jgi:hypothetical protein
MTNFSRKWNLVFAVGCLLYATVIFHAKPGGSVILIALGCWNLWAYFSKSPPRFNFLQVVYTTAFVAFVYYEIVIVWRHCIAIVNRCLPVFCPDAARSDIAKSLDTRR